ncbi:helix-turn-helix domain-containing protein [Gardnerella swidsinskii]|uniref:helix-turn-helix domain-containing protein n=1 Tax=Gardnerella swidsinskii TaxID=2792979 RepID=UPI0036F465AE
MGCTIPFNEKVLSEIKIDNLNNSGISEKISDINGNYGFSINETEKRVVKILINNSQATTSMIAEQIGVTRRTIQRAIASLYSKGIVEKVKSNNLTQLIVKR